MESKDKILKTVDAQSLKNQKQGGQAMVEKGIKADLLAN
jgi:hypothetical protein